MTADLPRLAIFARAPVRGGVKTRLAQVIGEGAALAVYTELLAGVLAALAPGCGRFRPEIWLDGAADAACFKDFEVFAQRPGDLGRRMAAAFDAGVTALVGSDIPPLTAPYVDAALDALAGADLVLGPVDDGGYALIAMNEPHAALFDGIPWSTPRVLMETLAVARRLSLEVTLLEPLWDVDDAQDLERWRKWMARAGPEGRPSDVRPTLGRRFLSPRWR